MPTGLVTSSTQYVEWDLRSLDSVMMTDC